VKITEKSSCFKKWRRFTIFKNNWYELYCIYSIHHYHL